MKKISLLLLIISASCCTDKNSINMNDRYRSEIIETEADFAAMAAEKGIAEAFYFYADDNAVINRSGMLIHGRDAVRNYYKTHLQPGTILEWTPQFADVSGSLGYTYGTYTMKVPGNNGVYNEVSGVFHTVWKRQNDGSWRFVWD